jgi:hypothetical protein
MTFDQQNKKCQNKSRLSLANEIEQIDSTNPLLFNVSINSGKQRIVPRMEKIAKSPLQRAKGDRRVNGLRFFMNFIPKYTNIA